MSHYTNMSLVNAVKNGNVNTVKKLLNNGANVNQADNENGITPLLTASRNGHTEVVKLLLNKGADVNKAGMFGRTPLWNASGEGHTKVVKVLLGARGIDVNKVDNYGQTPLIIASYEGHTEVVKLLLAKGADINQVDVDGESALRAASDAGHDDIVKFLMAKGADVNKADNEGRTHLWIATRNGHVSTVRELLKSKNVQVDKADKKGWTPLMIASQFGSPLCARALLKAGANVNKTKPDGVTALHVASFNDQEDVVKELLAAKDIDPFKQNEDGKTALDDAKSDAVKKLLRKAMGITTRWRNMNANQRHAFKTMLLERMIAKGFKNGKNATFTEPIIYANYSYRTLKPVNNKNKNITSFGLVIDDKNEVKAILDLEGARRAMRLVRERANRENKTVKQPLPGIIFENWSLVNFTPKEYFNAMKDLMKLSAVAKSARTRKNLESGRMNRIEANQRKTARIANLRSTIRKSRRELNNLM